MRPASEGSAKQACPGGCETWFWRYYTAALLYNTTCEVEVVWPSFKRELITSLAGVQTWNHWHNRTLARPGKTEAVRRSALWSSPFSDVQYVRSSGQQDPECRGPWKKLTSTRKALDQPARHTHTVGWARAGTS